MELLKFERAPDIDSRADIIAMLEDVLAKTRRGEVALAIVVLADEDYNVSMGCVVDSPLEVAGLLQTAMQADY